jgi:hypothetical protein
MSFSESFFEQVVMLALTAGVAGFLVPYILKRIDEQKLRETDCSGADSPA